MQAVKCKGLDKLNFCIATGVGPLRNAPVYCGLCDALNKIMPVKKIVKKSPCKYMTDLKEPLLKNYPCKGNKIACSRQQAKDIASIMSTQKCRPENCKYFTETP